MEVEVGEAGEVGEAREQSSGDGREGDEEEGAEVLAETVDEAKGAGEWDGFFDVEVESGESVARYHGFEREVVGFELLYSRVSCW